MARVVTVTAPARLHLGFLDLEGGLGRRFGSLGLTLDGVATRVRASAPVGGGDAVTGPEADRAARALARLRGHGLAIGPVRVEVLEAMPAHAGLGSGTQLGLAVGAAAARAHGLEPAPEDLGARLERGARSGIGVGAFAGGGVLLDGGKGAEAGGRPPPILARVPFPEAWRVLLLIDGSRAGLSGPAEREAFAELPPFPAEAAGSLCRLAVMAFLPGVAVGDLALAGRAVAAIQRAVGDHFAPAQGGRRFASPLVAEALARLEARGVAGVGQSSWGPTGFGLVASEAEARGHADALARALPGLEVRAVAGRNRGAGFAAGDAVAAEGRASHGPAGRA